MLRHVALLRGINVGTAKRIAMADLRAVFATLGYTDVRTYLQSGNVVLDSPDRLDTAAITSLEQAIADTTGVHSRVLVIPAERFLAIAAANPFADADDPSRMLVSFSDAMPDESLLVRPSDDELAPERIVFGTDAVYQWMPDGILSSRVNFGKALKPATLTTSRNLRTVRKIVDLISPLDSGSVA
jgi:uncharacterized protein (DUF1697 family)